MFDLWELSDETLKKEMDRRGYVVMPKASTRPLTWNRTVPIPEGVDFEVEALEKLRSGITKEMVEFKTRPGSEFQPEIKTAILRVCNL